MGVVVAPLIFAAVGVADQQRDFWTEFAVAIGFVGLSMIGLQFILVARVKRVAAPFGEDALIAFHRYMGYVGACLVFAHPVLLITLVDTRYVDRLNLFTAPWAGRFGTLAVLCILVVIITSVWRLSLRLPYEIWQMLHLVLTTCAAVSALVHVELVGYYVSQPWKRVLWVVMTLGFIAMFVWVRVIRPLARTRRPWKVLSVDPERGNVHTLTLAPVGHEGFTFAPGQFGWLSVDRSPFAITRHPFSFSSDGDDKSRLQMGIKVLGDYTATIGSIAPGARAYIDGPHGVFTPDRYGGPGFVFIVGGVGISPIMSMLRTFRSRQESRPCILIYGTPSLEAATFYDELQDISSAGSLKVVYVLSDPPADWDGERGFVSARVISEYVGPNLEWFQYFVCGPGPMQDAIEDALSSLHVPAEHVHTERFNFV